MFIKKELIIKFNSYVSKLIGEGYSVQELTDLKTYFNKLDINDQILNKKLIVDQSLDKNRLSKKQKKIKKLEKKQKKVNSNLKKQTKKNNKKTKKIISLSQKLRLSDRKFNRRNEVIKGLRVNMKFIEMNNIIIRNQVCLLYDQMTHVSKIDFSKNKLSKEISDIVKDIDVNVCLFDKFTTKNINNLNVEYKDNCINIYKTLKIHQFESIKKLYSITAVNLDVYLSFCFDLSLLSDNFSNKSLKYAIYKNRFLKIKGCVNCTKLEKIIFLNIKKLYS